MIYEYFFHYQYTTSTIMISDIILKLNHKRLKSNSTNSMKNKAKKSTIDDILMYLWLDFNQ